MTRSLPLVALALVACSSSHHSTTPSQDLGSPDCGVLTYCNCTDGYTTTVVACSGDCGAACASHGGVEPFGSCASGETFCNGQCRTPASFASDDNNCGGCDVVCVEYESCVQGSCTVALPVDGGFACRKDSDCGPQQACVLNPATSCASPFCATTCPANCANGSTCAPAIDVATSTTLMACIASNECS